MGAVGSHEATSTAGEGTRAALGVAGKRAEAFLYWNDVVDDVYVLIVIVVVIRLSIWIADNV